MRWRRWRRRGERWRRRRRTGGRKRDREEEMDRRERGGRERGEKEAGERERDKSITYVCSKIAIYVFRRSRNFRAITPCHYNSTLLLHRTTSSS